MRDNIFQGGLRTPGRKDSLPTLQDFRTPDNIPITAIQRPRRPKTNPYTTIDPVTTTKRNLKPSLTSLFVALQTDGENSIWLLKNKDKIPEELSFVELIHNGIKRKRRNVDGHNKDYVLQQQKSECWFMAFLQSCICIPMVFQRLDVGMQLLVYSLTDDKKDDNKSLTEDVGKTVQRPEKWDKVSLKIPQSQKRLSIQIESTLITLFEGLRKIEQKQDSSNKWDNPSIEWGWPSRIMEVATYNEMLKFPFLALEPTMHPQNVNESPFFAVETTSTTSGENDNILLDAFKNKLTELNDLKVTNYEIKGGIVGVIPHLTPYFRGRKWIPYTRRLQGKKDIGKVNNESCIWINRQLLQFKRSDEPIEIPFEEFEKNVTFDEVQRDLIFNPRPGVAYQTIEEPYLFDHALCFRVDQVENANPITWFDTATGIKTKDRYRIEQFKDEVNVGKNKLQINKWEKNQHPKLVDVILFIERRSENGDGEGEEGGGGSGEDGGGDGEGERLSASS